MNRQRIDWVDGIKGIASFCVFLSHFLIAFLPGSYYGQTSPSHIFYGLDHISSQSPFSFFTRGHFMVCLFCLISGMVLSIKVIGLQNKNNISTIILKRYFRLSLPLFFSAVFAWFLWKTNLYYHIETSAITKSKWLSNYYLGDLPLVKDLFFTSFISVWFIGNNTFSGVFWMLKLTFLGSYLSILLSQMVWKYQKKSLFFLALLCIFFIRLNSMYLLFVLGTIIALFMHYYEPKKAIFTFIGPIIFIIGCFFGGFPRGVIPTNIYSLFTLPSYIDKSQFFHIAGSFFVVLGQISYAFFLLHFPILFSFTTRFFVFLHKNTDSYQIPLIIVFISSSILMIFCAFLFTKIIENNISKLLKLL